MIYLDNNATTPILQEVHSAMKDVLDDAFGNPSSVYQIGNQARIAIEKARGSIAHAIGALPSEIIFTGSGTESDNLALFGSAFAHKQKGKNIVISNIEHPAVEQTAKWLEELGLECRIAPVRIVDGRVSLDAFLELMDEKTILVSCMLANNETGLILPVADLFRKMKTKGILCHTDAVQAFGKVNVNVKELNCDLLSVSAHKIHGPKGTGALYLKRGTKLTPMIHGGSQENSRRPGTENVAGIVGFGKAVEQLGHSEEKIRNLRDYFEAELKKTFNNQVVIHNQNQPRTPNTASVGFTGMDGNVILIKLDQKGICVSTGSACHSGALSTSSTLLKLGIPEKTAKGTIRFSLSRWTTRRDIEDTLQALKEIV